MGKITASRTSLRPDPKYQSLLAGKFINCLMYDGKKTVAQKVFYDALDFIGEKVTDRPAIEVFEEAVENIKPFIEVRSKRVGGASYQVPMQVNRARQQSLAIRWLLLAVREKKGVRSIKSWQKKSWLPTVRKELPCRVVKTRTVWRKRIRPLLTSLGSTSSQRNSQQSRSPVLRLFLIAGHRSKWPL